MHLNCNIRILQRFDKKVTSLCLLQDKPVIYNALLYTLFSSIIALSVPVSAEENIESTSNASDPMLLIDSQDLTVRGHFQFGVNAVAERNLFWDLAELVTGNTEYNSDENWLEIYTEPGVSFERRVSPYSSWFGKVSAVGAYTAGTDAFDASNIGSVTLEELSQYQESGLTLFGQAQALMTSEQYQAKWGALDNRSFVEQVSNAVIETPLSETEVGYWTSRLDTNLSREDGFVLLTGMPSYQEEVVGDGLMI